MRWNEFQGTLPEHLQALFYRCGTSSINRCPFASNAMRANFTVSDCPDDGLDRGLQLGDLCRRIKRQGNILAGRFSFAGYPISHF